MLLAVELTIFSATALESSIRLDWTTLSEIKNDKFEVLRGTDGTIFTQIGEVPGSGTRADPHDYEFIDVDVVPGVLYYYRLNQLDFDGTGELSNIVSAIIDPGDLGLFVGDMIPNPTVNTSYIDLILPRNIRLNVRILNMLGQEMQSAENISLPAGSQRINIDASRLTKGNYLVSIEFEDGYSAVRKMIVIE